MYHVIVHSNKYNTNTFSFSEKLDAINFVINQYNTMIRRCRYLSEESFCEIKTIQIQSISEYFSEHDFNVNPSTGKIWIKCKFHDLDKKYEKISWRIVREIMTNDPDIISIMTDPRYRFQYMDSLSAWEDKLRIHRELDMKGAAYLYLGDIGVRYDIYFDRDNHEERSCIYKLKKNADKNVYEIDPNGRFNYEIDPKDPNLLENLQIEMCKALIGYHKIDLFICDDSPDHMLKEIIGMKFETISDMKKWICKKMYVKEYQLPNFTLTELEPGSSLIGFFGPEVFEMKWIYLGEVQPYAWFHNLFSINYKKDSDGQMIVTDAQWRNNRSY